MQRVQDQDNGINIKFGPGKSRKGDYRLVSQDSDNKDRPNGTNKSGSYAAKLFQARSEKNTNPVDPVFVRFLKLSPKKLKTLHFPIFTEFYKSNTDLCKLFFHNFSHINMKIVKYIFYTIYMSYLKTLKCSVYR